jgi:P-type Cu+ transporter
MRESKTTVLFDVYGMWCTSCARALEKALKNTIGVRCATVNFTSGGAAVDFDATRIAPDKLVEVAKQLGYALAIADDNHYMHAEQLERQLKLVQRRLVVAVFLSMWIMLPQWMIYLDPGAVSYTVATTLGWFGLALSLPLVLYCGAMFLLAGWRTLKVGAPGMDTLVAIGSTSSLCLSALLLLRGEPYALYLDTGTTLIVLLLIARYIDLRVRAQAGDAVRSLVSMIPLMATVLINGVVTNVPTRTLQPGDVVRLLPGEIAQGDGVVVQGYSELDQSFLTGESWPRSVAVGDRIEAGITNLYGILDYQIDAHFGQRRIDTIIQSVRHMVSQNGDLQALTDVWSMRLSLAIFPVALLSGWLVQIQGGDLFEICQRILTVVVVTCPCALSLAIPLAFRITAARVAEKGTIIRHAQSVERAARFDCIVFDKTGTLTVPSCSIQKITVAPNTNPHEMLAIAASLAQGSQHHMAVAVINRALSDNLSIPNAVWLVPPETKAGVGITAVDLKGNHWFLGRSDQAQIASEEDGAMSVIQLRRNAIGVLTMYAQESLKIDAASLIASLAQDHMQVWLASGDNSNAVIACAAAVGIAQSNIRANCLPEDKAKLIKELQAQGLRVVFVGDGINDAPAMTAADLSIAVQGANRIAQTSASVVMTKGNLSELPHAVKAVLLCRQRMHQNLWWAVLYNLIAVPLAVLGWVSPGMAAAAMVFSSLSVTFNSARSC